MPFYRIKGLMVHMRGNKLPPACIGRIESDNPLAPSMRCMAPSSIRCDFPMVVGGRIITCDAPVCEQHAVQVGPDRHYCQRHAKEPRPQPDPFK